MNFLIVLTRTSEQITGTPLLKETLRVIIVDIKDIHTNGMELQTAVCNSIGM